MLSTRGEAGKPRGEAGKRRVRSMVAASPGVRSQTRRTKSTTRRRRNRHEHSPFTYYSTRTGRGHRDHFCRGSGHCFDGGHRCAQYGPLGKVHHPTQADQTAQNDHIREHGHRVANVDSRSKRLAMPEGSDSGLGWRLGLDHRGRSGCTVRHALRSMTPFWSSRFTMAVNLYSAGHAFLLPMPAISSALSLHFLLTSPGGIA
jgi:hypothetical protein